jgi:hypothetical protein
VHERAIRKQVPAQSSLIELPRVKALDPVLQLTSRGAVAPGAPASMMELREEFRARRCVRVTSFVEPRLLSRIQEQIADAAFADRAHGTISTELCMQRNACLGLLHFLVNDPSVFRFVEQVSGCHGLTFFVGRVYRMLADREHYDSWHADLHLDHQLGMSVNLGTEPFEGGVFEIRRADRAEPLAALANVGSGDAILFSIADDLEHRLTPMRGPVAKTAFAGWFGATRDYRDLVHPTSQGS